MNNLVLTKKIGRLTPIKPLDKRLHKRIVWLFKCDCGEIVEAPATDVLRKRKLSCGCLQKEHMKNCGKRLRSFNTKPDNEGPINKLFGRYKREALKRKYEWFLTIDEFKELIIKKCYYCNSEPKTELCIARTKTVENTIIYNGIDRKDNNIGYTRDNCIPACTICNRMKMNLDYSKFLEKIQEISKNIE